MLSMVEYVHQRVKTYPQGLIGVDMTMGNGYDTELLANHCQKVYAFDVQEQALSQTKERLGNLSHVQLILDSHENIDQYLQSFDIGIFNLGYLPGFHHQTTTLLSSTRIAIEKAIEMMREVIFIVVYPGHDEGRKESEWVMSFAQQLDTHLYNVSNYCMLNKRNAPYVIEIQKRKGKNRF